MSGDRLCNKCQYFERVRWTVGKCILSMSDDADAAKSITYMRQKGYMLCGPEARYYDPLPLTVGRPRLIWSVA